MKKLSMFAVAFAAMMFAACGGNKTAQNAEQEDSVKSFEQEQIDTSILEKNRNYTFSIDELVIK